MALQHTREEMLSQITSSKEELKRATEQLQRYKSSSPAYFALAQEYARLLHQIEEDSWALVNVGQYNSEDT